MQKYSPISDDEPNMQEDSERGTYYWCADVDARIAELHFVLERIAYQYGIGDSEIEALRDAHDKNVLLARKALGITSGK